MNNRYHIRLIFILETFLGVGMVVMGLVVSVRPYVLLDVVLAPQELADKKIHDDTLALLQRAAGHNGLFWMVLGTILFVMSLIGLRLTSLPSKNP